MRAIEVQNKIRSTVPSRIRDYYKKYLLMEAPRSLSALSRLPEQDVPSIATLKRWSARYGWASSAAMHDEFVSMQMSTSLIYEVADTDATKLKFITIAKRAFYDRLERDIQKLQAGGKDPRRFLKINVRDYIRLVRLERELHAEAVRMQS